MLITFQGGWSCVVDYHFEVWLIIILNRKNDATFG